MKVWILLAGVYLLASAELPAQSGSTSLTPLSALAYQFGMEQINQPQRTAPPAASGGSLVSLQQMQHPLNKRARRLSEKGMREYLKHHYRAALPLLHAAVELDPQSSLLENNLGVIYCALGEDKDAQRAFQNAVEADPSAAMSYTNLAAVSFNLSEYPEAETSARQALRLDPTCAQAEVMLGLAEVAQSRWTPEARKYLEDNREQFRQAQAILERWPSPNTEVVVRAPGH